MLTEWFGGAEVETIAIKSEFEDKPGYYGVL